MKRICSACLVILIIISASTVSAAAVKTDGLLLLGDSIATGYGLRDAEAESYGAMLAEALDTSLYSNLAINGATSGDLAELLEAPAAIATVSSHSAIVISIGGNDVLRNAVPLLFGGVRSQERLETVIARFSENIEIIFTMIKNANPNARVFIQTVYNPFSGVDRLEYFNDTADAAMIELNNVISESAAQYGYTVVDIYDAFYENARAYTNIMFLDIHPNSAGHALIFEMLYSAMEVPVRRPGAGMIVTYDLYKYVVM